MKIKYFVAGMISLIVFGLLLPQPIQALFVYTSLKSFFDSHLVLLCILVGAVQGVENLTKESLWNGREWVADYRRLRAIAHT